MLRREPARLRRSVALEALLGVATLYAASMLSALPPGLHEQPWWPLPWRPDLSLLADDDLRGEVFGGMMQLACAATLLLLAVWWRHGRLPLIALAAGAAWFALPHLGLLLVPAEPTVF